ncbi:beta strand repeat-containing protein, partial [Bradyrhizobium oropedii]|uniref:beta strand repeat-containing protein n=1 Tax=Bradyrhizobium oropedii TaxID=1571201 RepID=UPI001E5A76C9
MIALSSLVTVSDPNSAGYQTLQLWDSNGTVAGGEFLINGVAQTAGHAINVPSGANVVFDAGTSAGTDTLYARLVQNNGALGSWQQFTVSVAAPTLSVSGVPSTTAGAQIALSSLVNVSDPSNATYQLQLWDSNGTAAGGEFLINGVAQTAGHAINVPSGANVVFDAGTSAGTDTLFAQLVQNGTASGWQQFTVSVPAPTLNVSSLPSAAAGAQIALSSLVNVSDPSNATYQLQLWDSNGTAAGGEFLINGVAQTAGHAINVPSGANVVFDAGTSAGTDTLWAQLIQGNGTASGWQQFTVSVPAPTLNVSSLPSVTAGAQIALSSLVNVSDPSNATYQLQLWDSNGTVAGGEFLINGVAQTAGQAINVPSGANVVFDAGTSSGTDTLWAQLIQNGTASGWKQFAVSVAAPTLNVSSLPSATAGAQIALSSLVNVSDPSNATYQLQLWDSNGTAAGGEVLINGVAQTAGQAINVPSGANVVFDAGTSSGTDTLWAQLVQNGTASGWKQFTVSVAAPTLNVSSLPSATAGAQIALSSLVNVSNPSNATYQLQLWDSNGTAAGGEVLINGVAQPAGQAINVPSGANVVFDAGTSAGSDTLWARLIQNGTAGGWQQFSVSVATPTLSVSSVPNATAGAQIALSSLVNVSDPSNATYQ